MFQVRVTVRGYELDSLGHLNQAVYLQYAEHARWEILRAAGLTSPCSGRASPRWSWKPRSGTAASFAPETRSA